MRQILFRGKSFNRWVYGWYVGYSLASGYIHGDYVDKDEVYSVDAGTVGQYTGVMDISGKKIFEGDIVEYICAEGFDYEMDIEKAYVQYRDKAVVQFHEGQFWPLPERHDINDYYYSYGAYGFRVIGNIHENPELIKED